MPPTPDETILIEYSSLEISFKDVEIASAVPATSVLITTFNIFLESTPIFSKIFPRESSLCLRTFLSLTWIDLKSEISLASFSVFTTWKSSPALGAEFRPSISTAIDGVACLSFSSIDEDIFFILPYVEPETTISPTDKVPFCINNVATAPRYLSSADSITTPWAGPLKCAFSSSNSDSNETDSSNLSIPEPVVADTGIIWVVPPQSSGTSSWDDKSPFTFSGSASSRSILLIATTIETPAAFAWLIASIVWGMTLSLAATTKITMSVVLAPLARISLKAACPGVSMKVNLESFTFISYAPICCVIPPASSLVTLEFLMKSNKEVFPWSTCPITVITGDLEVSSSWYEILPMICSSTDSDLIAMPLCPNSSVTRIAVSWSIESFIVAATPRDIRAFTTSPPLIDIFLAKSPTRIVSGISISFFLTFSGFSNWWAELLSKLDSFLA